MITTASRIGIGTFRSLVDNKFISDKSESGIFRITHLGSAEVLTQ